MGSNLVTLVRNLQQRKGRRRRKLAAAEGVRLVEEALAAGVPFRGALAAPSLEASARGAALLGELAAHAVPIVQVTDRMLASLADTDEPQGVLAVIEPPQFALETILPARGFPVLVLDGVQDPGNVGTLLRTAYALGSPGALLLTGTADLANPKVIRAGMGATLRLPSVRIQPSELARWAAARDVTIWAATADGTPLRRVDPPERLAVVVGNEGTGVRPAVQSLARHRISIPLARGAESLNVAIAAGIILHEVQRAT